MRKISQRLLLDFTANLSLLLEAGLPLPEAVDMIGSYSRGRKIKELTDILEKGLKKGNPSPGWSIRMSFPFPPIYRGLISIGERVGSLTGILPALTSYLERQKKLRDKMLNASLYPLMVLVLSLLGMLSLALFILPKMEELFSGIIGSGAPLTELERNIALFSGLITAFILLTGLLVLLILLSRTNEGLRAALETITLRIPGLRRLLSDPDLYSFTFAVEILTGRGVALSKAVAEAAPVCRSLPFRRAVLAIEEDLVSGLSLYQAFERRKIFPERVVRWAGIGEQTGKSDQVFKQLRIYYEEEIENRVSRLMGIIEPLLIVLVGIFIIALILTFVVPLISVFGTVI